MLDPSRIAELLATRRPAPSRGSERDNRLWALYRAKRGTEDPWLLRQLDAEIAAVEAERLAWQEARMALEAEDARSMETCPLRPVDHGEGLCDGCAGELPPARRRWCSDACASRWWANHAWTSARWEAVRRSSGITVATATEIGRLPGGMWFQAFCDACGASTSSPEVNHVDPRVGRGYGPGCHNHQVNLQVLCHSCHVAETTLQRAERTASIVWLLDELEAVTADLSLGHTPSLDPAPPAALPIEYGSTLGIPSAGAWDVAS